MQKISDLLYVRKNFLNEFDKKHNAPPDPLVPKPQLGDAIKISVHLPYSSYEAGASFQLTFPNWGLGTRTKR